MSKEAESLRQQLAKLNSLCEFNQKTNEQLLAQRDDLVQQLADSRKQAALLREALSEIKTVAESSVKTHGYDKAHVRNIGIAKNSLSITSNQALDQLAHSQKQMATLRADLKTAADYLDQAATCNSDKAISSQFRKTLAATADLGGLILCHAEPMAWTYDKGPIIDVGAKIPLYRAWEPK